MSCICDVVVYIGFDNGDAMASVNEKLDAVRMGSVFRRINMDSAGGTKVFCGEVWAGAFNHTLPSDIIAALVAAEWSEPEQVIVVMDAYDYEQPTYARTIEQLRYRCGGRMAADEALDLLKSAAPEPCMLDATRTRPRDVGVGDVDLWCRSCEKFVAVVPDRDPVTGAAVGIAHHACPLDNQAAVGDA